MCSILQRARECAPATDRIVSAIFPFIYDVNVISIIFLSYCDYARSSDIQSFYSNTNRRKKKLCIWIHLYIIKIIWEFDVLLSFHWSQIKMLFSEMSTRSSIYIISYYVILLICDNKLQYLEFFEKYFRYLCSLFLKRVICVPCLIKSWDISSFGFLSYSISCL